MRAMQRLALWTAAGLAALTIAGAAGPVSAQDKAAPPPTPAEQLKAARPHAVEQLLRSIRSEDPYIRANAMEATQHVPARATPLLQLGLDDPHPAVRFAAAATIGNLELKTMAPAVERLLADKNESVRAAAMFALKRCGQKVDLSPLAGMLVSQDPSARGNAAMLLGRLSDRSAVPMLLETAKAPMPRVSAVRESIVRIQVAEAVVRLGETSALDAVRAGAYSPFDEVRVLAVQMMGRLGDQKMVVALAELLAKPPIELQLAAAEALARLGKTNGLDVTLKAAASELATVRGQAAMTLGQFKDGRAVAALVGLLDDPQEQVRLAAASAVLDGSAPTPAK